MGWQVERWGISVHLDAHGGDKERAHDALWEEMQADLNRVMLDPKYADLNPM
jgi:hypothetical protein